MTPRTQMMTPPRSTPPLSALAAGAALALLSACERTPAPPPTPPLVVDARAALDARAAVAAAPDLAPAAPPPKPLCEVEITGMARLPKGAKKGAQATIIVAQGDCLSDGRVLGRARSTPEGKFFIEVFSDWGADLTVCAAMEEAAGRPVTLYGKAAGTFHAEAHGEVEFKGLDIAIKAGAPRSFAEIQPRR